MSTFTDPLNRRVFVTKAAQSLLGVTAASQLTGKALAIPGENTSPLKQVPTARNVIYLYMNGGMSHLDTFDPKPMLDRDHGKPPPFALPRVKFAETGNLLKSPWKFRQYGQSGLPVSDLFPHVAKHVDDMCIIRSMHGTNPAHGGALLKLHTGSDTFVRPSMGSWVAYGLGTFNENLPGFVVLNGGQIPSGEYVHVFLPKLTA